MIKLEMKLNDSLIQADAAHTPAEIYDAIDKVFAIITSRKYRRLTAQYHTPDMCYNAEEKLLH